MKDKHLKYITIVSVWTILSASLFIWCHTFFKYSYFFAEQLRMFEWDSTYAWDTLLRPMGWVNYFADFVTQFYIHPYIGAFFTTLVFLAVSIGLRGLLCDRKTPYTYIGICLLPGLLLSILSENQFYLLENSLAMVNVVLLANIYVRISSSIFRSIAMVLGGWLLYFTSGAAFVAFLIIGIGYEFTRKAPLKWYSILWALFTVLPIALLYFNGNLAPAALVFTPACYMNPNMPLDAVSYSWLIMIAVALIFLGIDAGERKPGKTVLVLSVIGQIVIIGASAKFFYDKSFSKNNYIIMQADYMARHKQWDELIAATDPFCKNLFVMTYRNYGLAQKGTLADIGMAYRQSGKNGLIVPFNNAIPVMAMHSDFNYAVGNIALAQRYAFETMIMSRNMGSPRMLLRLVQTNLINGAYGVAEKYIAKLENSLYYDDMAHHYRQFLYNDTLVEEDKDLGPKRKGITGLDGTVEKLSTLNVLFRIYKCNPDNKVLFQYLTMLAILEKDLPSLELLLQIGAGTDVVKELPVHVQEGMVMYYSEAPEKMEKLDISPAVKEGFYDFVKLYNQAERSRTVFTELSQKYKNTVWFYFLFKK